MKSIVLIGQALPRKQSAEPFGRTRLYDWLNTVGITKSEALNYFSFTALVDKFPGIKGRSHKQPTEGEITKAHPKLMKFIQMKAPDIIVPLGSLAIKKTLCVDDLRLTEVIGTTFVQDPFASLGRSLPIIPLPHPSTASPWIYLDHHKELLNRALHRLAHKLKEGDANVKR